MANKGPLRISRSRTEKNSYLTDPPVYESLNLPSSSEKSLHMVVTVSRAAHAPNVSFSTVAVVFKPTWPLKAAMGSLLKCMCISAKTQQDPKTRLSQDGRYYYKKSIQVDWRSTRRRVYF